MNIDKWPEKGSKKSQKTDANDKTVNIEEMRHDFFGKHIRDYDYTEFHECKKWECECDNINFHTEIKNGVKWSPSCKECGKNIIEVHENQKHMEKLEKKSEMTTRLKFVNCIVYFIRNKSKKFNLKPKPELIKEIIKREWNIVKKDPGMLMTYEFVY